MLLTLSKSLSSTTTVTSQLHDTTVPYISVYDSTAVAGPTSSVTSSTDTPSVTVTVLWSSNVTTKLAPVKDSVPSSTTLVASVPSTTDRLSAFSLISGLTV